MSLERAAHMMMTNRLVTAAVDSAEGTIDRMEAALKLQTAEIRRLQLLLADAQSECTAWKMGAAGLAAQGRVLKAELKKVAPQHSLFANTGLTYSDGSKQTQLNAVYDAGFDAKAVEFKMTKPGSFYRDAAK